MSEMSENDDGNGSTVPETSPLASAPMFGRPIDPYEDTDMVVEGSDEANELDGQTDELSGKTKEDLYAQLKALQNELSTAKSAVDPVRAMTATLKESLGRQQQPAPFQFQPPQESVEARRTRLNNKWLEDPVGASEEMQREQMRPLVDLMLSNQAALSKDLALSDPAQRTTYDKWGSEVEAEVAGMSPVDKAQNPRVYQTAIARVRGRHTDDVVADMVEAAVQKRLSELGIDPNGAKNGARPAVYSPAGQQRSVSPGGPARKTVVVPRWVVQEADRQGLDPKFYYQHLKENGRLK